MTESMEKQSRSSICCSRIGIFLVLFTFCFYFESMGSLYVATVVQSLERQFQISSKMSALLVSAHEFGYIPAVVFLSYLGSRGNRARWIGGGCLLISVGNLLASTPGFAFPEEGISLNETKTEIFNNIQRRMSESIQMTGEATNTTNSWPDVLKNKILKRANMPIGYCNGPVNEMKIILENGKCEQPSSNQFAYGIVLFALVISGIGHSLPWSLGVPLIDDNVKRTNMPVFFALLFLIKVVGPASAFFIGGAVNSIYTTLKRPIGMTPGHPQWIGAWWLGYLITAVGVLLPALGIFCFPTNSVNDFEAVDENDDEKATKKSQSQMAFVDKHIEEDQYESGLLVIIKKFFFALTEISKSKVYIGSVLGKLLEALTLKGHVVFLPKYISNQFGISLRKASNVTGLSAVGFISGLIFGSFIMRRLKLEGRKAAAWVGICSLLNAFIALGFMIIGCHSVVSSIGQLGLNNEFNFTEQCNIGCLCKPVKLLPVCSKSGQTFFSPCHAGCRNMTITPKMSYSDCSCADNGNQVSSDWCTDDCGTMLTIFVLLFAVNSFILATSITPGGLIILRSVPPEHRSISLGVSTFILSLGTLVGPLIFGSMIDLACLKWEEKCEGTGSCSIYDATQLRIRMYGTFSVLKFIALIFDIWVWYFAKDLVIMKEIENDEDQNDDELLMEPVSA